MLLLLLCTDETDWSPIYLLYITSHYMTLHHLQASAHLDEGVQLAHGGGRGRGRDPLLRQRRDERGGEAQGGRQLLDCLV